MFRLSKYIKKEIKKKKLSEAWENLNAVSPEIRKKIKLDKNIDTKAEVKIVKYNPAVVFKKLMAGGEDLHLEYVILRYGHNDLAIIDKNMYETYHFLSVKELFHLQKMINNFDNRSSIINPVTVEKFTNYCNDIIEIIANYKDTTVDEIEKRMNFQLIYCHKMWLKQLHRNSDKKQDDYIVKNGIKTLSNKSMEKRGIKDLN